MQELYIRLYKATKVHGKAYVTIKDIADVSGPAKLKKQVESLHIINPQEPGNKHYVITIIQLIDKIHEHYPDVTVQSVGEMDGIVDYSPQVKKQYAVVEWGKVALICAIVFAGTMVAIMAYQTDVSLRATFQTIYEILTGEVTDNPVWLTIPYSIGMPIGIIVFFNHVGTKQLSDDPTPIEVEINSYEKQVDDTMIDNDVNTRRSQTE